MKEWRDRVKGWRELVADGVKESLSEVNVGKMCKR